MHYLSERIRKDKNFTAKKQIVIDNQIKTFPGKQFAVDVVQLLKNEKHIIAYHILDIFLL